jgi:antitoxin component YwqK of YwqJK toxin-antitoxin module
MDEDSRTMSRRIGHGWRGALQLAACVSLAWSCAEDSRPAEGQSGSAAATARSAGSAYELAGGPAVAPANSRTPVRAWPALPDVARPAPLPTPDPELPPRGGVFPDIAEPQPLLGHEGRRVQLERSEHAPGRPERIAYTALADDGRRVDHGPDLRWHDNGVLAWRRTWRLGALDGLSESWHKSGQAWQRGEMRGDLKVGRWSIWYETGAPRAEQEWRDGLQDGLSREWHPEGARKSSTQWKAGVLHGPYRVWHKDGGLAKDGSMVDGLRDGPWREWAIDGAIEEVGSWSAGRRHGEFLRAEPDGSMVEEAYDMDAPCGTRRVRAKDGTLLAEQPYVEGKLHGVVLEWTAGGVLKSRIAFEAGVRQGKAEWFHADGTPWIVGAHKDGKRSGRFTYTNPDGTLDAAWSGEYVDDKRVGP